MSYKKGIAVLSKAPQPKTVLGYAPGQDEPAVARGDMLLDDVEVILPSQLESVLDADWTKFVQGMMTAKLKEVSLSNCLGMFELSPRRLNDLGLIDGLVRSKSSTGRSIWVGVFRPPTTHRMFLLNPKAQYDAFCVSMKDYVDRISTGVISKSDDMSLSGALAILHRAGPRGLDTWAHGERFESTEAAYNRVAGVF